MDHQVFVVDHADKVAVAAEIAARPGRTLFFVRTKHGADRLAKQLTRLGVDSAAIHGNLNQNQRTRALEEFSSGRSRVLTATDVAARGLHVDDLDLVVHFDPPSGLQGVPAPLRPHRACRRERNRGVAGRAGPGARHRCDAPCRYGHAERSRPSGPGITRSAILAESGEPITVRPRTANVTNHGIGSSHRGDSRHRSEQQPSSWRSSAPTWPSWGGTKRGFATQLSFARGAGDGAAVHEHVADLAHLAEVRRLADELRAAYPRIDVLANNAGALFTSRHETPDGLEQTFALNHLAPFLLTNLLLDRLVESHARVVTTSSDAHKGGRLDLDDLDATRRPLPSRLAATA